jgi:secernin
MCDTIAAAGSDTATGAVLFGKNSDRDALEAQYLEWRPAARYAAGARVLLTYIAIDQARETHAVLLSKPHWIWGAEIGANEHGLTIGNEAIFSRIACPLTAGVIGMDYLRLALERARDVEEAIFTITSLLRRHGQSGNGGYRRQVAYHNSYILADPRGACALETVDREWVVKRIENHHAISNAMTLEADFDRSSATLRARAMAAGLLDEGAALSFKSVFEDDGKAHSGNYRRQRATQLLAAANGRLQPRDFFRILRDHLEGPAIDGRPGSRICAHRSENPIGQTTASWVADLSPGRCVHWLTGTAAPCTGLFKPMLLEVGLPDHGPKPGEREDPSTFWWRHEQLRRLLDESDGPLRESFIEERNRLEERFLEDMTACPAVSDEVTRNEAHRIVDRCWRDALNFESRWHERLSR